MIATAAFSNGASLMAAVNDGRATLDDEVS
jgi:hypothetical protein